MSQKVIRVFRIANGLLIDQIGLEYHPAAGRERVLICGTSERCR
jgi:hypothetical protein